MDRAPLRLLNEYDVEGDGVVLFGSLTTINGFVLIFQAPSGIDVYMRNMNMVEHDEVRNCVFMSCTSGRDVDFLVLRKTNVGDENKVRYEVFTTDSFHQPIRAIEVRDKNVRYRSAAMINERFVFTTHSNHSLFLGYEQLIPSQRERINTEHVIKATWIVPVSKPRREGGGVSHAYLIYAYGENTPHTRGYGMRDINSDGELQPGNRYICGEFDGLIIRNGVSADSEGNVWILGSWRSEFYVISLDPQGDVRFYQKIRDFLNHDTGLYIPISMFHHAYLPKLIVNVSNKRLFEFEVVSPNQMIVNTDVIDRPDVSGVVLNAADMKMVCSTDPRTPILCIGQPADGDDSNVSVVFPQWNNGDNRTRVSCRGVYCGGLITMNNTLIFNNDHTFEVKRFASPPNLPDTLRLYDIEAFSHEFVNEYDRRIGTHYINDKLCYISGEDDGAILRVVSKETTSDIPLSIQRDDVISLTPNYSGAAELVYIVYRTRSRSGVPFAIKVCNIYNGTIDTEHSRDLSIPGLSEITSEVTCDSSECLWFIGVLSGVESVVGGCFLRYGAYMRTTDRVIFKRSLASLVNSNNSPEIVPMNAAHHPIKHEFLISSRDNTLIIIDTSSAERYGSPAHSAAGLPSDLMRTRRHNSPVITPSASLRLSTSSLWVSSSSMSESDEETHSDGTETDEMDEETLINEWR